MTDLLISSAAILRRVADLLDQEVENGDFDALPVLAREAVSDLAVAAAESARATREIYGFLSADHPDSSPYNGSAFVREETAKRLPLNRKERFYTGTVLPMIVAGDDFAHLGRFLQLCDLDVTFGRRRRDGSSVCQLLTEYGFAESLVGTGDDRWDHRVRHRDTPDLVLVGNDWLVAVEAKMFDRPTRAEMEPQLASQRVLIDEWVKVLAVPLDRVRHVALLPQRLAMEVANLSVPVVTWEQVADAYRTVGPPYWVGVLDVACERWPELVALPRMFGRNAEAKLTGQQIADLAATGALAYGHMGRSGGLAGVKLAHDVSSGAWRSHTYEVRGEELADNPNWFPVVAFLDLVQSAETDV